MGDQNMVITGIIFFIILIHLAIDDLEYILCEQRMFSKYPVISWDTVIVWKNVKKNHIGSFYESYRRNHAMSMPFCPNEIIVR